MLICLSHALYRIGIITIKDSKNDSTKLTRINLLNQDSIVTGNRVIGASLSQKIMIVIQTVKYSILMQN